MKYFTKFFKSFTSGFLALAFLMAVTMSACSSKKSESGDSETQEAAGDHPTENSEHPTEGEEHPAADSTATDSEHPTDAKEHPTESK